MNSRPLGYETLCPNAKIPVFAIGRGVLCHVLSDDSVTIGLTKIDLNIGELKRTDQRCKDELISLHSPFDVADSECLQLKVLYISLFSQ